MTVRIAILAALLVATSAPVSAQGSREDQAACRSDTRRFCRTVDPDSGTFGILNCLKQNRAKLSKACRGVLESHGQ
jgi:hypothetical protein